MYCSFISCIITQLVRQLKVGVPSVTHLVPSVTKIEKVPQIISCLVIIDKNEPLADQQALGTKKTCLRVIGGFFGCSLRYQISQLSRQDFTQFWLPNVSNHLRWVILKFCVFPASSGLLFLVLKPKHFFLDLEMNRLLVECKIVPSVTFILRKNSR